MLLKVMTRYVNRNSYLAVPATLRVQRNQSGMKVQIRWPGPARRGRGPARAEKFIRPDGQEIPGWAGPRGPRGPRLSATPQR